MADQIKSSESESKQPIHRNFSRERQRVKLLLIRTWVLLSHLSICCTALSSFSGGWGLEEGGGVSLSAFITGGDLFFPPHRQEMERSGHEWRQSAQTQSPLAAPVCVIFGSRRVATTACPRKTLWDRGAQTHAGASTSTVVFCPQRPVQGQSGLGVSNV